MNKHLKRALVTGAGLLLLASFGSTVHSVHASMPSPENYRSTNKRNNVYYGISNHLNNEGVNYYLYGKMPKPMLKRGHVFGLYYGKRYNKEVSNLHSSLDKVIHRHGQTYYPDYVGYLTPHNKMIYHGRKGYIEDIYINKKDVNLRHPLKNSFKHLYILHSIKYQPVTHAHRKARTRKAHVNYRRHHAVTKKARTQLKNKYGYYKHGVYHKYKTGYYRRGHWMKYRKANKQRHYSYRKSIKRLPKVLYYQPKTRDQQISAFIKDMNNPRIKDIKIDNTTGKVIATTTNRPINLKKPYTRASFINDVNNDGVSDGSNDWNLDGAEVNKDYNGDYSTYGTTNAMTAGDLPTVGMINPSRALMMKLVAWNDMQGDRGKYGLRPYSYSDDLTNLAATRAREISTDFSHDQTPDDVSENIAEINNDSDTGSEMANTIEDDFMNHDQNQGNGHRDNILGDYSSAGVAVYTPDNHNYYLAEDFQ